MKQDPPLNCATLIAKAYRKFCEIFPCDAPTLIKLPYTKEQQSQIHIHILNTPYHKMATVYKSLSKVNGSKDEENATKGPRKNKQRVLILSSRGVTYR